MKWLLLLALPLCAEDLYIAQTAAGGGTGANCANALAVTFFNNAANWGAGAGKISAGDTVHVCGTISTQMAAQGSGTAGNPITITFETHAQISLPACDNTTGCLNIDNRSYIIVDGGTPCGPGTSCAVTATSCAASAASCGTGSIVQTSNGTGSFTITNITCSGGIATVTGPSPFGFTLPTSSPVTITGNSVSAYNNTFAVVSDNDGTNTFTFATTCAGTGTGGQVGVLCPSGSYCANNQDVIMVNAQNHGCANCEIKNLIIGPLGVRTSYQDNRSTGAIATIYFSGCSSCTVKIHDNVMPFGGINYIPTSSGDSGLQIYNNEIYNFNGAINIASSVASNVLSGAEIYNNYLHDAAATDGPGCPAHHNGIHVWGLVGGVNSNINFYNNWISGNFGGCATGAIFFEGNNRNVTMYNNVITISYTQDSSGVVDVNGDGTGFGYKFFNNTIFGYGGSDICFVLGGAGNKAIVENNIITGCWTTTSLQDGATITTWDYNQYGCTNLPGSTCVGPWDQTFITVNGPTTYYNFAGWQAACSCDSHSAFGGNTTSYMKLNSNGSLQSGSPAIGAGVNLTTLGIALLNFDTTLGGTRASLARPSAGAWDVGAYQFAAAPVVPVPRHKGGFF